MPRVRAENSMVLRGVLKCTVFMLAAGVALAAPSPQKVEANQALVKRYCVGCHNEKLKTGGMVLENLDLSNASAHAETLEKVIRKLRTGAMPPLGMPRPDKPVLDGFVTWLETSIDSGAMAKPNPGRATLH